jgi:hypothetical protein
MFCFFAESAELDKSRAEIEMVRRLMQDPEGKQTNKEKKKKFEFGFGFDLNKLFVRNKQKTILLIVCFLFVSDFCFNFENFFFHLF